MPVKIEPSLKKPQLGDWSNLELIGDWGRKGREAEAVAIKKGPKVKRHPDSKPKPRERIMKVRMLRDCEAALDGINAQRFSAGEKYDVPESRGKNWIQKGIAEEDYEAGKGIRYSSKAQKNKMEVKK